MIESFAGWVYRGVGRRVALVGFAAATLVAALALAPATALAAATFTVGPVAPRPTIALQERVDSEHLLVQEWRIDNTGPDAATAVAAVATHNRYAGATGRSNRWTWNGADVSASCPIAVTTWPAYATTCSLGALAAGEGGVLRFETRTYADAGGLPLDTTLAVSADGGPAATAATSSVPIDAGVDDPPECTVASAISATFDLGPVDIPYSCTDIEGKAVQVYFGRPNQSSSASEFEVGADRIRWNMSTTDSAGEYEFSFYATTEWSDTPGFRQVVKVTRSSVTDVVASIEGPALVVPGQDAQRVHLRLHNAGAQRSPSVTLRLTYRADLELDHPYGSNDVDLCTQHGDIRGDWFCGFEPLAPGETATAVLMVSSTTEFPPTAIKPVHYEARLTSPWLTDGDVNTGMVAATWDTALTPKGPRVATLPRITGRNFVGSRITCHEGSFSPAASAPARLRWHLEGFKEKAEGDSITLGHVAAGERIRCESFAAPTPWGSGTAASKWMTVYSALRFRGTRGNDQFGGDDRANSAVMLAGHDGVDMGGGHDRVDLGPGNDGGFLGEGNDVAKLGPGNDAVAGEAGNDRIDCGAGKDLVDGRAGNDVIRCNDRAGRDRVYCGYGNDVAWVDRGDAWYDCDTVYLCTRGTACVRKVYPRSRSRGHARPRELTLPARVLRLAP